MAELYLSGMHARNTYILLPGAGLGPRIWDPLVPYLTPPVLAARYPRGPELGLSDYVEAIIEQVDAAGVKDLVLVAHSIGGCLAPLLCAHYGDRVRGLVAVGAVVPPPGGSFAGSMPVPQRWMLPWLLRFFGTRPPDQAIRNELCQDLDAEQTAAVIERFTPESRRLYTDPVRYTSLPERRLYVRLTDDRSLSQALQGEMSKRLDGDVASLPTGHLPMLSRPAELARIIAAFSPPSDAI